MRQIIVARTSLLMLVLLGLAGCGRNLPQTVPVSGRVAFGGEPPPAPGIVNFQPVESADGLPLRPGSGRFGKDGHFEVTSFDGHHGLVPGRYRVTITCLAGEPAPVPGGWEKASYVPANYEPPELTVEPGAGRIADLVYDVPPKPRQ